MTNEKNFAHPSEYLKWTAVITMAIDHIGYALFPEILELRMIGRIAFPIFAFFIAVGYMRTSSVRKYYQRLILFALISQIPYSLLFQTYTLNVLFTFLIGLLIIHAVDKKKYIYLLPLLFIPVFVSVDYEMYGILLPLIFYLFINHRIIGLLASIGLTILFINVGVLIYFQLIAIVAVLLCYYFPTSWTTKRLPRYFLYGFYPAHIFILYLITFIL